MQVNIEPNANASMSLESAGAEETPIITFDNALNNAEQLFNFLAQNAPFEDDEGFYPGKKSPMLTSHIKSLMKLTLEHLERQYNVPPGKKITIESAFYSYVCTTEDRLKAQQARPHRDGAYSMRFAIMQYLGAGDFGGTGFFRHRNTGFERVSESRLDEYSSSIKEALTNEESSLGYMNGSDKDFEMIFSVPYKANRVLIYPGNLLHSGLIDPERDLSLDPIKSRLTANIFLEIH